MRVWAGEQAGSPRGAALAPSPAPALQSLPRPGKPRGRPVQNCSSCWLSRQSCSWLLPLRHFPAHVGPTAPAARRGGVLRDGSHLLPTQALPRPSRGRSSPSGMAGITGKYGNNEHPKGTSTLLNQRGGGGRGGCHTVPSQERRNAARYCWFEMDLFVSKLYIPLPAP